MLGYAPRDRTAPGRSVATLHNSIAVRSSLRRFGRTTRSRFGRPFVASRRTTRSRFGRPIVASRRTPHLGDKVAALDQHAAPPLRERERARRVAVVAPVLRRLLPLLVLVLRPPPPWRAANAAVVAEQSGGGLALVLRRVVVVVAPVLVAALAGRGRTVGARREVERGERELDRARMVDLGIGGAGRGRRAATRDDDDDTSRRGARVARGVSDGGLGFGSEQRATDTGFVWRRRRARCCYCAHASRYDRGLTAANVAALAGASERAITRRGKGGVARPGGDVLNRVLLSTTLRDAGQILLMKNTSPRDNLLVADEVGRDVAQHDVGSAQRAQL